ncbi:MAG: patatin family protein [Ruminiclostridium sp.]|nr:patatin family protein [Ruminiclostridium sp.]
MKTGLVLEGGASRTIFTCGILDALLDNDIYINYVAGASAGISYGVSYLSKQPRRNHNITANFMHDKRYMGMRNMFKRDNRSYYGLDFVFEEIPSRLLPYDFEEYRRSGENGFGAVTNIETGKTEYMRVKADDRKWTVLRASCALPILFRPIKINGSYYMDGGITDSIPFKYALDSGLDKVIVILTRPRGYVKKSEKIISAVRLAYRKYPMLAEALKTRHIMYNREIAELEALEQEGKALVLAPEKDYGIHRTENDPKILLPFEQEGYDYGIRNLDRIKEFIEN